MVVEGVILDLGGTLVKSTSEKVKTLMNDVLFAGVEPLLGKVDISKQRFIEVWTRRLGDYRKLKDLVGDQLGVPPTLMERTSQQFLEDTLLELGVPRSEFPPEFIRSLLDRYYEHEIENVEFIEGAVEALDELRAKGVKLAMITNAKDGPKQHKLLEHIRLLEYFPIVVVSADIGYRKPDSRVFAPVLEEWSDMDPSSIVMVGDMQNRDILGANRLGLRSVWLKEEYRNHSVNEKIRVDHIISDIRDLPKAVESINAEASSDPNGGAVHVAGEPRSIIKIGYFFPQKKIDKFAKQKIFANLYRQDCEYIAIDPKRPFAEQGPFDVVLHKATHTLVQRDAESRRLMDEFQKFVNANVAVDADLDRVRLCTNRRALHEVIEGANLRIRSQENIPVRSPKSIQFTVANIDEVDWSSMKFPLIVKNVWGCGSATAHQMAIVYDKAGLEDLDPSIDWFAQEYIDHDAIIYKIYNLGKRCFVDARDSLPNLNRGTALGGRESLHSLLSAAASPRSVAARSLLRHDDGTLAKSSPLGDTSREHSSPHADAFSRTEALARNVESGATGGTPASGSTERGAGTMLSALRRGNASRSTSSDVLEPAPGLSSHLDTKHNAANRENSLPSPSSTFHFNSADIKALCHQFRSDTSTIPASSHEIHSHPHQHEPTSVPDNTNANMAAIPESGSVLTPQGGLDSNLELSMPASSPVLAARNGKLPPPPSPRISQYEPALNPLPPLSYTMQTALHAASPRYSSRPVPTFHPSKKASHAKRHSEPVVAVSSSESHKSKPRTHGHSLSGAFSSGGRSLMADSHDGGSNPSNNNHSSHEVRTQDSVAHAASELAKTLGNRRLSEELFSSDVQHLLDELTPKSSGAPKALDEATALDYVYGIVEEITEDIRKTLQLELFGYDLLIEHHTGAPYIVDINYFPSYAGVADFESSLLHFLVNFARSNKQTTGE